MNGKLINVLARVPERATRRGARTLVSTRLGRWEAQEHKSPFTIRWQLAIATPNVLQHSVLHAAKDAHSHEEHNLHERCSVVQICLAIAQ